MTPPRAWVGAMRWMVAMAFICDDAGAGARDHRCRRCATAREFITVEAAITPMPTPTPTNERRMAAALWWRRSTSWDSAVGEHHEGGEQPGHHRLGDVDVQLLVQVRR